MGLFSSSPEQLWQRVCKDAKEGNITQLNKSLPKFRAKKRISFIQPLDDVFKCEVLGNTFALAMELLETSPAGSRNLHETAQLLLTDWQENGNHLLSHNRLFKEHIKSIIDTADPERIRIAVMLCSEYIRSNLTLSADDKYAWLRHALTLTHHRAECVRALKGVDYTQNNLTNILGDAIRNTDERPAPRLDAAALTALLELRKQTDATIEEKERWEFLSIILEQQPAKSLLTAMQPLSSSQSGVIVCSSALRAYCAAENNLPDALRLQSDAEYRALQEDIRQGVLEAYSHFRPRILPETISSAINEADRHVLAITAHSLKQRIQSAITTQELRNELLLYQQMGLLPDLFTLAGPATGFATDLEYKTALRERILDAIAPSGTPARDEIMDKTCWAEYVRTKPLEREGSATAAYAGWDKSLI